MSKENNKRGKYNEKYNLEALAHLEFILDDTEYWMTSLQLAKISGREHRHVREDIRRDIIGKLQDLRYDITNNGEKFRKVNNIDDFLSSIDSCKYDIKQYKDSMNRKQDVYILNREASLLCLARYNFIVQTRINQLFLDLYDKENGHLREKTEKHDAVVKTTSTKYDNVRVIGRDELFEILRNNEVLQSSETDWNIPCQFYVNNGYFRILLSNTVNGATVTATRITPKGFEFIENLCNILGYVYDGNLEELKTFVSNDDYGEEELDFYK